MRPNLTVRIGRRRSGRSYRQACDGARPRCQRQPGGAVPFPEAQLVLHRRRNGCLGRTARAWEGGRGPGAGGPKGRLQRPADQQTLLWGCSSSNPPLLGPKKKDSAAKTMAVKPNRPARALFGHTIFRWFLRRPIGFLAVDVEEFHEGSTARMCGQILPPSPPSPDQRRRKPWSEPPFLASA
ncbi:MAG: hypothetical protein CM15mP128_5010 [Methanobacteriota archaeon]|nr:MAG: hypothetical protein CM15mP128_5010 [Euryarchaeota archaeon]